MMAKPTPTARMAVMLQEIVPRLLIWFNCARLAARLCAWSVIERLPDGRRVLMRSSGDPKLVVLALTAFKFRGDLDALAAKRDIRLLEMPHLWQMRLLFSFYPKGTKSNLIFKPETNAEVGQAQQKYRAFLRTFLRELYTRLHVACVIAADVRYREDIDIGVVSKEIGVPYLVFHRECMLASKELYDTVCARHSSWGRFSGSAVIVHNQVSRRNFVESGFVEPERVEILGSARMDEFLHLIETKGREPAPGGLVVLFSFYHPMFKYPQSVFDKSHVAAAMVAKRNPGVQVVIKPKLEIVNKTTWRVFYDGALRTAGIDPSTLPNLMVTPTAPAQSLIRRASVVCAINSTTLLEAGAAGVPVVVPCFSEIQGSDYIHRVNFREELGIFDVPGDMEEMVAMIERRLRDTAVDPALLKRRRALFEQYVTPTSGGATDRYRATIFKHVVAAGAPFVPSSALPLQKTDGLGEPVATAGR